MRQHLPTGERMTAFDERSTLSRKSRRILGIVAATGVFLTTACSGDHDSGVVPKDAMKSYSVASDGVHLNVETSGNSKAKDVVIAVHGGPGLSLESLDDLKPLGGDDRLLVRYDQRGAGESTAPTDQDYSLESQVADLEAVRQSTGAETVDLIGESWGGLLATAYAASHPEHVDDLALIDSIPLDIPAFLEGQDHFHAHIAELQQQGLIPNPLPEIQNDSCADQFEAVLPAYLADPTGERPEDLGTCTASTAQYTFEALMQPGTLRPYIQEAKDYTGDVLVLAGDQDAFGPVWPRTIDRVLARASVRNLTINDAGHLAVFEQPSQALPALDSFLD